MIGKWVGGLNVKGGTPMEGIVEGVKWLDGEPMLQVHKSDGSLADLEMNLVTLIKEQSPVSSDTPPTSAPDATDTTDIPTTTTP